MKDYNRMWLKLNKITMYSSLWLVSVVLVLTSEIKTSVGLQNNTLPARRCNQNLNPGLSTAECPSKLHYCITTAVSPNFISSLQCGEVLEESCSILYSSNRLVVSCSCVNDLCNQPLTEQLVQELKQFSSTAKLNNTNSTDVTSLFFNTSLLYKSTNQLFDAFDKKNDTIFFVNSSNANNTKKELKVEGPKAELLKHEVIVPSDDDEEGDGSGGWDDTHNHRRPGSVPSAPSSYLPSQESRGSSIFINLLVTTLFLLPLLLL